MSSRPEHNNLDMEGALASSKKVFERKLEANRRNAQLSTGPRTSEGKAISRFNAVIHGLVGKQLVRALGKDAEGRAEFELVLTEIRALYQPFTVVEELLVEKVATAYWRLQLGAKYERELMSKEFVFHEASVDRLGRYMAAANREFYQAQHELERIQRQRLGDYVPAALAVDVQVEQQWEIVEPAALALSTALQDDSEDEPGRAVPNLALMCANEVGCEPVESNYETNPPGEGQIRN
jgi:hypothetical protein